MAELHAPSNVVYLHPSDNICVLAAAICAGAVIAVGEQGVRLREDVPMGHKVAVAPIRKGEPVRKYGQIIGWRRPTSCPVIGSTSTT